MIKEKLKAIVKNKIFIGIVAVLLPFLIEILVNKKLEISINTIIRVLFIYGVYALIGIYYIIKKYFDTFEKIADFIIRKRYIIAIIVLVVTVLLKINFSSIAMWSKYVGEENTSNVLIGVARSIRSDEWLTQSPLMLGQIKGEDAYKASNRNIEQGNLNMIMTGMPVKDITTIAKPLSWGYLLFGEEYGFSFYWMLKMVLLFLVSLEISMKISKKDKLLTLTGAIILACAPAIMWWLSSAIAEGYIFGMLTVILFSYYMNNLDWKLWKKIGIAIGLLISITAFAFVLYPAFQVPFAFFMAIMMLSDFIPNVKKIRKVDICLMILTILGILFILSRLVIMCWSNIQIMMNTVYPGKRISVGGDFSLDRFVAYFANIFFPYGKNIQNPCEPSGYIYSFSGLVILLIYSIKNIKEEQKSLDFKVILSLTILYVIFLLWEFIGFGETFAKITFLSMVPSPRLHVVTGFIGIILSMFIIKKNEDKKIFTNGQAVIISSIVLIISIILIKNTSYSTYFNFTKYEIWAVIIFALTYLFITGNKKAWCCTMCLVSIIAGATINPICIGISPIKDTKISGIIQQIKEEDNTALWAGNSNITGQYLVANGVNTLNGVHTYPNFKWLNTVDPEGKYNEVYNRFAHIHIALGEKTEFNLLAADSYVATLTYEDLKKLEVKYYYTNTELSEETINNFNLECKYSDQERSQYIYTIN